MSLRCFRADNLSSVSQGSELELEKSESAHLFKILRGRPGDIVGLLDGLGNMAKAEILKNRMLKIIELKSFEQPEKRIHLYLAPPRRQKMDIIIRQATELGVWRIAPLICDFSVAEPDAGSIEKHWTETAFEACKQSANPFLPKLEPPVPFAEGLKDATEKCSNIYYGSVETAAAALPESGDIAWFIGPEGGFSEKELAALKSSARPLKIGKWILRVETAAAAGIAKLI